MSKAARQLLSSLYRVLLALLMRLYFRPRKAAVLFGKPDYEENILALLPELCSRYAGEIILLCSDQAAAAQYVARVAELRPFDIGRVKLRVRTPLNALLLQATAEIVMFSTPIYASARPVGKRVHINVWHGTGPKWSSSSKYTIKVGANALCSCARAWAPDMVRGLNMDPETTIVVGNPRQDHLAERADVDSLTALGLDPNKPFVVWAPTYRESKRVGAGTLTDTPRLSEGDDGDHIREFVTVMRNAAERSGVQLIAKPHPMDADSYASLGLRTMSTEEIWQAGCTLYQFLGAAAGVISDFSSIWVDYLDVEGSVGIYCPDLELYAQRRQLNSPRLGDVAAEVMLTTDADVDEFFGDVGEGRIFREERLAELRKNIDYVDAPNRSSAVVSYALRAVGAGA